MRDFTRYLPLLYIKSGKKQVCQSLLLVSIKKYKDNSEFSHSVLSCCVEILSAFACHHSSSYIIQ